MKDFYESKDQGYFLHQRGEILEHVPPGLTVVLDVGCGAGYFGSQLKKNGTTVWGIEIDTNVANIAKLKIDHVINKPIEESWDDLNDEYFDCIFFNDVLEHLIDPWSTLMSAKRKLKPGGFLIASIPNLIHFNVLWDLIINKDFRYQDAGILDRTHLRFFTKKTMLEMFNASGFAVKKIVGINPKVGRKWKLANFITLNSLNESKFVQFLIIAQ